MKKHLSSIISLVAICAVVSVLMALTNHITAPIIEKNQSAAANEALTVVLPGGEGFTEVDLSAHTLPATITKAYSAATGGYVFEVTTTGYAANLVLMIGIGADGTVKGSTPLASGETLGKENTYGATLLGTNIDTVESVDIIAGATRTTQAYRDAVKDCLGAAVILGGGSVDLRSEEEILNDALSEALPTAEGKFTPVFITEIVENITAVYVAENQSGYVFVTGENYVATDNAGVVISDASDETKGIVATAAPVIIGSKLTEIDLSSFADMPSQVQKAYKTDSGNFVFELRAAGFGINGDSWYNPSGEYIYIKVSATAEGKIIACQTVSQKESDGIGSACGDAAFYTQFNGTDATTYKDIDAISGATVTTNGYKSAVAKVFDAIKILKGEPLDE